MMEHNAYMLPNPVMPSRVIFINTELCGRCGLCMEVCRADVLVPPPEEGEPPVVLYPEECWFCGCCTFHCPVPGAIRVEYPLNQRIGWKRMETGEYFRIGMKNPPPPSNRRPVL
jgi:NAD-dependent dihydropyrimidine dehydrogenase PreA subunit